MGDVATGTGSTADEPLTLEDGVAYVAGRMRHVLALVDQTSNPEDAARYLVAMADGILGHCIALGGAVARAERLRTH